MRRDKREYACETVQISSTGIVITCDVRLEIGEPIVAFFDLLGAVQGRVGRKVPGGYVLELETTDRRRAKLEAQVQEWAARLAFNAQKLRRHRRLTLKLNLDVDLGKGPVIVRCLNISVSGALLEMATWPPIGSTITVAGRPAKIVRHDARGIGVEFETQMPSLDWAEAAAASS